MSVGIVRRLSPEEEELVRKQEELSAVRATLAEREFELADLRAQLRSFEGRYLREVGVLYAELDEWEAKIAELEVSLRPSAAASERARKARKQAEESHEATHGEASKARDFQPSADLKSLFREVAKRIHPDFAKDDADRERRTRMMAQANEAYDQEDTEFLRRILDDYHESSESVQGEGIGAELIRIIRQIHQAKKDIAAVEQEIAVLRASDLAQMKGEVEAAWKEGRDMLGELALTIRDKVSRAKAKYAARIAEAKA